MLGTWNYPAATGLPKSVKILKYLGYFLETQAISQPSNWRKLAFCHQFASKIDLFEQIGCVPSEAMGEWWKYAAESAGIAASLLAPHAFAKAKVAD